MSPEQQKELVGILSQISNLAGMAATIISNETPQGEFKLAIEPVAQKPRVLPLGWKKLNAKDKKSRRVESNSPMMIEIGSWFGRQATTLWTIAETESLLNINPSEKEVAGMGIYYSAEIPKADDHRRGALETLLNNWSIELDRARKFCKSLP